MRDESVRVDLNAGRAIVDVRNLQMKDHFDIQNALIGGGQPPAPAVVSYRVEWTAIGPVNVFDNVAQQFRGEFRYGAAQMAWSARTVDFDFVSAPLGTSTTDGAQFGTERNGAFY